MDFTAKLDSWTLKVVVDYISKNSNEIDSKLSDMLHPKPDNNIDQYSIESSIIGFSKLYEANFVSGLINVRNRNELEKDYVSKENLEIANKKYEVTKKMFIETFLIVPEFRQTADRMAKKKSSQLEGLKEFVKYEFP